MRQESMRTILAGGALAVALTLAGAAPAHAAAGPGSLWSWLTGLRSERIAAPWIGTGRAPGGHRHPGTLPGKAGSCVDPNGCLPAANGTTDTCGARNAAGICLDPQS